MSLSNKIKYLIINADDFGYCSKRDRAIIDLFEQECISSTSLLVNGCNASQACTYAKTHNLPMGIHLNLTEGRPVTQDLCRIESLIDSDGFMHGKIGLRNQLEKRTIKQEHIEYEIEMQLKRYEELTGGKQPGHIDGHQHIHVHPIIVESVARSAQQHGIKYIRAPYDRMILSFETDNSFYKEIVHQTKSAIEVFDRYALIYPNYFVGMTMMGNQFTLNNMEKCFELLDKQQTNTIFVELMCHPGYPSDPFMGGCGTGQPDDFSQSNDRQVEFNLLSSRELRNLFEKYRVQLCIYDHISFESFY